MTSAICRRSAEHRDVNNTTCPGDEFYMQLDTVRMKRGG